MATSRKTIPLDEWTKLYFANSILSFKSFVGVEMDAEEYDGAIVKVIANDGKEKFYVVEPSYFFKENWFRERFPTATYKTHFKHNGTLEIVYTRR